MITYKCEECGKEMQAKSKSLVKRFCSHKCANRNRWNNTPKKETMIVCKQCGKTFPVKSSDYRLSHGGIKYCSRECADNASRVGSYIKCEECGKEFYTTRNTFCSPECARSYRSKHYKHQSYIENGYIVEYLNGYNKKGNVKQHRRIIEEKLGRRLLSDEIVHHINGDKTDNRVENLQVMTRGEHNSLHRKKEKMEGKHLFGGYHNN